MGPEDHVGLDVERILHVAGGVVLGDVEGLEIVVVELDVRPLDDLEAQGGKDADDLVEDMRYGVLPADGRAFCRAA